MSLVHVVAQNIAIPQRAQHAPAPDPQDDLLTQPIALIATIQLVGQAPIAVLVAIDITIEKVHRDAMTVDAHHFIAPGAQLNCAILDNHFHSLGHLDELLFRYPAGRVFTLLAGGIKHLAEITLPCQQGDSNHVQAHIGSSAHSISGENTEPSRISSHIRVQADFH